MVLRAGYLVKRGRLARTWKKRWFVLYEDRLLYFADHSTIERKGFIPLHASSTCYPQLGSDTRFTVMTDGRELLLQAGADRERIEAIASHRASAAASATDAVLAQFSGALTARVICATNLTPKDPGGTSDPFCLLRLRGGCHRTPVAPKTLEPSWDDDPLATATLPFHRTDSFLAIEVWDHDFVTADDFLGRAIVPLAAVGTQPMRRWCPLGKRSRKSNVSGAVLVELYTSVPRDLHFWSEFRRVFSAGGFALPTAVVLCGADAGREDSATRSAGLRGGSASNEASQPEDALALALRAFGGGAASAADVHAARFQSSGSGLAWMFSFAAAPESPDVAPPTADAAGPGSQGEGGHAIVPHMRPVAVATSGSTTPAAPPDGSSLPASVAAPLQGIDEDKESRFRELPAGTIPLLGLNGDSDRCGDSSTATAVSDPQFQPSGRDTPAPVRDSFSAAAGASDGASTLERRGWAAQQICSCSAGAVEEEEEEEEGEDSAQRTRWATIQRVGRRALQSYVGGSDGVAVGEEGGWGESDSAKRREEEEGASGNGEVATSPWTTRRALQQSPLASPMSLGHCNDSALRRLRGWEGCEAWTPASVTLAVEIPEDWAVVVMRSHPGREALLARGRLWLTNLRLVFEADGVVPGGGRPFAPHLSTVVPLASVHGVTMGREAVGRGGRPTDALVVQCADLRTLTFFFMDGESPAGRESSSPDPQGSATEANGGPSEGREREGAPDGLGDYDDGSSSNSDSGSGISGRSTVTMTTTQDSVSEVDSHFSFKGLQVIGDETEDSVSLHDGDAAIATSWTTPAKRFLLRVQHRMLSIENDAALHYSLMHAPLLKAVPSSSADAAAQSRVERNGWLFSSLRELKRLGLPSGQWAISQLNEEYAVCGTYPRALGVPAGVGDEIVAASAKYRSKGRFPVLSWLDRASGAAIMRCAQPLRGIQGAASAGDQQLVDSIRRASATRPRSGASRRQNPIVFVDCRPRINALGNQAVGKGFEDTRMYSSSSIVFLGIENIHVMRSSLAQMRAALLAQSDPRRAGTDAEPSGWLLHVSSVLSGAVRVACLVHVRGVPCIVHCSDGWDRTPQVTATAQLLLDPHFRTSAGFVDLLHKEFLSFGHKMAQRCGFKAQGPDSHDFSPIVLQWLDCVHQVVIQCPSAFEYTPAFLATVADLLYSGFVGETLCDSERERDHRCVRETTLSLARLCNGLGPACLNAAYAPVESMLTVDARPVSMRLWREWFLRWDLRTRAVALYAERSHLARRARRTRRESQTRAADAAGSAADTSADGSAAQPKLGHPTTVSAVAWVPDHASTHCSECHLPFSLLRRLRHCGVCGRAFCKACSRDRVPIPGPRGKTKMRRVCGDCYAELQ